MSVLATRLPSNVLQRELLVTLRRRRATLIKCAVPLALCIPLVAGGAPTFWAGMLLTVMVAMVGAVGSAVTLGRARDSGFLRRLALTPQSPARLLLGWSVAQSLIDTLQFAPVVALVWILRATPADGLTLLATVILTILFANLVGCMVSLLATTAADVLLDCIVVIAPLLFLGGLFTGVPAGGAGAAVATADPFAQLHSAFISALGGTGHFAAATELAVPAAATLLLGGVCAALAGRILRR